MSAFTIRFRTSIGTFRSQGLTPQSTLDQLIDEIHHHLSSSRDKELHLYRDQQKTTPIHVSSQTLNQNLQSLNISHGDMIFVQHDNDDDNSTSDSSHDPKQIQHDDKKTIQQEKKNTQQQRHDSDKTKIQQHAIPLRNQMNRCCSKCNIEFRDGHYFQAYQRERHWSTPRMGYLIGHARLSSSLDRNLPYTVNNEEHHQFLKDSKTQQITAKETDLENRYVDSYEYPKWEIQSYMIYEPLQKYDQRTNQVRALKRDRELLYPHVETLSKCVAKEISPLGRVGWIFTHDGRIRNQSNPLTTQDAIQMAKNQHKYGDYFITVTCSPTMDGSAEFLAWQLSTQAADLIVSDILIPHPTDGFKFTSIMPIDILKEDKQQVDVNSLIIRVPIGNCTTSPFESTAFPSENRPDQPQALADLHQQVQKSRGQAVRLFRDAHVLLFLLQNKVLFEQDVRPILEVVQKCKTNGAIHDDFLQSYLDLVHQFSR